MNMDVLAIYDDEQNYSEKLYEYFCKKQKNDMEVVLFTSFEALMRYCGNSVPSVLLISEDYRERAELHGIQNILWLSRSKNCFPGSIYKYQSAMGIYNEVFRFCSENGAGTSSKKIREKGSGSFTIYGIYSPIKRAYQSTFAITLGQLLAKKGKCIYLNFESFSGFDSVMAPGTRADLMDLLYFWQCGGNNFSFRLDSVIDHIGSLDYVPPIQSYLNLQGIGATEWIEFIKAFEEYTDYEYMILDLSENVNGLFDVMKLCSRIFTITDDKSISKAKMSQYEGLLSEYSCNEILDKTSKFSIPIFREIPKEYEMLPYSQLATYIKKELDFGDEKLKEILRAG